tara:strand:- start:3099 stop:3284 length:186 start_codon:yes stop_codon:yes gene_type:complete
MNYPVSSLYVLGLSPQHKDQSAMDMAHVQRLVVLIENKGKRATHRGDLGGMVASALALGNF